jgi:hypothetical protein
VTVKVILKTMRCKLFTDESDRVIEKGEVIYILTKAETVP